MSLVIVQLLLGTLIPLIALGLFCPVLRGSGLVPIPDELRRIVYFVAAVLIQTGIFSTRWNVVIGGQLFSKSLKGLTVYKMQVLGLEGLLMSMLLLVVPYLILFVMVKILPPWPDAEAQLPTAARVA
jgi:hypothetical protein